MRGRNIGLRFSNAEISFKMRWRMFNLILLIFIKKFTVLKILKFKFKINK